MKSIVLFAFLVLSAHSIFGYTNNGSKASVSILKGNWRGVFELKNGLEIPFNFEIRDSAGITSVALLNAEERFQSGSIKLKDDSVFIALQPFDNELALKLTSTTTLNGVLRRQDLNGSPIPVQASKGVRYRFVETGSTPTKVISGRYDVVFTNTNGKEEKAVAVFRQNGNKLVGSFLKITGDSRFLEGIVEGDQIQLSSFIGSSPSYYRATIQTDGSLKGENINTRGIASAFIATPNANAALPDAFKLTSLKNTELKFTFKFPDALGTFISSEDARFAGKPLIVAIGGTWCPNCMDEASFLAPWYQKNKERGIEVVGLQFEREIDSAFVRKTFDRFKNRYNITYPLLIGGTADKQEVIQKIPALQNFISFPTTLFINKYGKVEKIHTGFSGPATGEDYTHFVKEFNELADALLKQ